MSLLALVLSGVLVGVSLGLIGGGGSVLAVPLLVYAVGLRDAHQAIGTSAVAVAGNALVNLFAYARQGAVKWRCAAVFAGMGVLGAHLGAEVAKTIDSARLLAVFGAAMIMVGLAMARRRADGGDPGLKLSAKSWFPLLPALLAMGFVVGLLAGFFGIGGGVLIVPGLIFAAGMTLPHAIATSLFAVAAFGVTTALTYAASGFVDWAVAAQFFVAGLIGSALGRALGRRLANRRKSLARIFSAVVCAVGVYVMARSLAVPG